MRNALAYVGTSSDQSVVFSLGGERSLKPSRKSKCVENEEYASMLVCLLKRTRPNVSWHSYGKVQGSHSSNNRCFATMRKYQREFVSASAKRRLICGNLEQP